MCEQTSRRFGKSMAANMLVTYYSRGCDSKGLFQNYKIAQDKDFERYLNRYNVIHINMLDFLGRTDSVALLVEHFLKHIVRELIDSENMFVKKEIEELISGSTIEKQVHEDITYEDIHKSQDNLWNFLFFTGYLKSVKKRFGIDTFTKQVNAQLVETISYYDYSESYYHGFLCGLLKGCNKYVTMFNRKSGNGRPDIVLAYPSSIGPVVILELKVAKNYIYEKQMLKKKY